MVLFDQTLSDPKDTRVFKEAQKHTTGLYRSRGKLQFPPQIPAETLNDPEHIWEKEHFLICVKARLKMGFPGSSAGKEFTCSAGDLSSIPGLGRSPGERNSYSLLCSGLEISIDCIVYEVAKSRRRLRNVHFHFTFTFRIKDSPIKSNQLCPGLSTN